MIPLRGNPLRVHVTFSQQWRPVLELFKVCNRPLVEPGSFVGVRDPQLDQLLLDLLGHVVDHLVVAGPQVLKEGVQLGHQLAAEVTPGVLATITRVILCT